MRKILSMTVAGLAVVLMLTPVAQAITITDATLSGGNVTVSGNKAAKAAPINWEGTQVATSTNGGAFTFTTGDVPLDCIGSVEDGTSTVGRHRLRACRAGRLVIDSFGPLDHLIVRSIRRL